VKENQITCETLMMEYNRARTTLLRPLTSPPVCTILSARKLVASNISHLVLPQSCRTLTFDCHPSYSSQVLPNSPPQPRGLLSQRAHILSIKTSHQGRMRLKPSQKAVQRPYDAPQLCGC
jgi:hypothetical protein